MINTAVLVNEAVFLELLRLSSRATKHRGIFFTISTDSVFPKAILTAFDLSVAKKLVRAC